MDSGGGRGGEGRTKAGGCEFKSAELIAGMYENEVLKGPSFNYRASNLWVLNRTTSDSQLS